MYEPVALLRLCAGWSGCDPGAARVSRAISSSGPPVEPTVALLRRLAAALDADVRLTAGHDLGSVWFETHAA